MNTKLSAADIIVTDGLVPIELQIELNELVSGPIWKYGWKSNTKKDRFCYWHSHFAGGGINSRDNCEAELLSNELAKPIAKLWGLLKDGPLKNHALLRAYANSHTFGVEGYVHVDNKDTENYYSTIYYAHDSWNKNWGGETNFFDMRGEEVIKSVYPKPGRISSFPGSIPHCAHAPSRDCSELRISIVLKTERE